MTNSERYRSAFSHVRAPSGCVQQALEQASSSQNARPKRRPLRRMVILAAAAAILTMSVGAELSDGSVSNLLAPLYGNAQTELVDNVGRPVDASVTVNGYTLTADAVIGDRYNIAIVYTLTRDDGQPIPENVSFDSYSNAYHNFSSGGGSWQYCRDGDLPDNQLRIVERWTSSAVLPFFRGIHVVFEDLEFLDPQSGKWSTLAEGTWELRFTARYRDTTISVPSEDINVPGTKFQIYKILLSPLGIHMDLKLRSADTDDIRTQSGNDPNAGLTVSLHLTDGTDLAVEDCNLHFGGGEGSDWRGDYGALFDQPIPLEDIQSIVICGTEVPVEIP